jgi:hypothetical protein
MIQLSSARLSPNMCSYFRFVAAQATLTSLPRRSLLKANNLSSG